MKPLATIEAELDAPAPPSAAELLGLAEDVLEHWIAARGGVPTSERKEGFRILALHRQGARGVPSFNACRETCREIAYHYNLLQETASPHTHRMMALLVKHLALFVHGKLEVERLGEFCCSSRALRVESHGESEGEGTRHG